ncbi:MAG: glycosyltransferase [Synechococcaceae cyanobacterium]|nr:glycosyltransferase [Synechococcaceae cyanobacterium]
MVSSVSIVIEWENVLLSGSSRAARMLERVIAQANRQPAVREILISATDEQPALKERPAGLRADIAWRLLHHPGRHYYELKNLGAQQAGGDRIVFVDSDVIPEADWLEQLLAPFADPATAVSCGRAYIDATDLYTRAFALFWFFPVRDPGGRDRRRPEGGAGWPHTHHFFANNIAFRRTTALAHPFPASSSSSRGACLQLADSLRQDGIAIVLNNRALVAHPPPLPGEHFTQRALAQGRDRYLRSRGLSRTLLGSCWRWGRNSARTLVKIAWLHRRVDLPLLQVPLAWLIGLTYYGLYWLGEVGTILKLRPVLEITI